eukprot:gene15284-3292_t
MTINLNNTTKSHVHIASRQYFGSSSTKLRLQWRFIAYRWAAADGYACSAAPFATDIPDGDNAPKEQVGQKKSMGQYAPPQDTAKPWAEGDGSKAAAAPSNSSSEYVNADKPSSARAVPESSGVPWATN